MSIYTGESREFHGSKKAIACPPLPALELLYISLVGWVQEMADVSEVIAQLFPPGAKPMFQSFHSAAIHVDS